MKNEKKYHGVVVPMVTPFTKDYKIDETATIKISDYLMNAGTIPFLLGTTGESASIPFAMRNQLVKVTAEHVRDQTQLYAGISANCLDNSILAAKQYYDYGVDACVAHLPSKVHVKTALAFQFKDGRIVTGTGKNSLWSYDNGFT